MAISFKERYLKGLCKQLADEGERIINIAWASQQTTRRSGAMDDAYGAGVFLGGKLVERRYITNSPTSSIVHRGWEKNGIPADTGRGYLDDFFNGYKASPNMIELVCVNAVYYTRILEDGKQRKDGKIVKYRIISQVADGMSKLASKYHGHMVTL